ncbi:hypothetical protein AB8A28_24880 [Tardiphaga sp. 71_E8_N1_1]|uniref:hypothetical protein n=1 Tax=Tardiphaga sp. 71_E8_N1_1 TaxID=3240784 RepID=UPI003F8BA9AE
MTALKRLRLFAYVGRHAQAATSDEISIPQAVTFREKNAGCNYIIPEVGVVVVASGHGAPSLVQGEYLDLLGPVVSGRHTKPFRYEELQFASGLLLFCHRLRHVFQISRLAREVYRS